MGQRQSTQSNNETTETNSTENNTENNTTPSDSIENTSHRRGRAIRPTSRNEIERNQPLRRTSRSRIERIHNSVPTLQFIPVNESQRREERRRRREFIRERVLAEERDVDDESLEIESRLDSATRALGRIPNLTEMNTTTPQTGTTATMTTSDGATISPFSRMIAQVISEAVVASFRSGQIQTTGDEQPPPQRQQLTMHLSPELFRQMEPNSTEDIFMRFLRLPVLVTTLTNGPITPSTGVNADGERPSSNTTEEETEITRMIMLPVFLYGLRSQTTQEGGMITSESNINNNINPIELNNRETRTGVRSSARIRERIERERNRGQENTNGQWTVYIISGNSIENMMNDSPSYEELLNLAAMIGPARRPTVSQEAIDRHLSIVQYTPQVKQSIVGNSDKCQVCLNIYQSNENIRILSCHHGFHKDCIDQWLTEGQNKCPLCRNEVIPTF